MTPWLSWGACTMVVDFGRPQGDDPGATPLPTGPDSAGDTAAPTEPTEPTGDLGVGSIVGGRGDTIGSGGLWWVPAAGPHGLRLAVGSPARGDIVLFSVDTIGPRTALAAGAAIDGQDDGVGAAFAVTASALAVGAPDDGEVWLLDRDATGPLGRDGALAVATADESGGGDGDGFGTALAVGDLDGDGLEDLVIGNPDGRGGDGTVSAAPLGELLDGESEGDFPFRLRGAGNGTGGALAVGDLDGTGRDAVVACEAGGARCWVVAGDADADDQDIDEVAEASIDLPGAAGPAVQDVDGDGVLELVIPADGGAYVFRRPAGAVGAGDAVAVLVGGVAAVGADGVPTVWAGLPADDAVYGVPSPTGAVAAATGTPLHGTAGSGFGAAISGREAGGRLAVAAPASAASAGEVRVYLLPEPSKKGGSVGGGGRIAGADLTTERPCD